MANGPTKKEMIMKKILKSLAALALVISAGCVNELANDLDVQAGKTVVTVGLEATKTCLGDLENGSRKVYWSEGDQIAINGVASTSISIAEGNTFAEFSFEGELNRPFSILYPASGYVDPQKITLPAVQAAATGTFASGCAPMAGYAVEGDPLQLHHLAAVVRLQVKLPAESTHAGCLLSKVEFRGKSDEQVSGMFSIDYEKPALSSASDEQADKVVTTMVGQELSTDATDIFVVVPAQEYAAGFSVRLIDSKGHYMDIDAKSCTLEKGEIKVMPPFDFAPTKTLAGVVISSAAELVAFATDYNNGEYSTEESLEVIVTSDIEFDDVTNAGWMSIGTSSLYFKGTFDGGNFSIKNWVSSKPLFFAVYAGGTVKNLNIDGSCALTANYDEGQYFGGFIGYHNGVLENCYNYADLKVAGTWETDANVGGLVGRVNTGKVHDCYMNGNVTADGTVAVKGNLSLGGIAGCVLSGGEIVGSHLKGNLTVNGGGSGSSREAYIGGVAGLCGGKIEASSTYENTTVLAERIANNVAKFFLGGVLGVTRNGATIVDCTNNSFVHFKYPKQGGTRYAYVGGVVGGTTGATTATIRNCTNNHAVQLNSDYSYVYLGGVIGHADAGASIENCHNSSNGSVTTQDPGTSTTTDQYLYMGGVVGRCASTDVANISNAAKVEMSSSQSNEKTSVNVGGCIGFLEKSLDGNNNISNSGHVTATDVSTNRSYLALGGVIGTSYGADAFLSNLSNTGNVTDAVTVVQKNAFCGGVVGLIRNSATVQSVTNSGKVSFSNDSQQYHVNVGLGGIVGAASALQDNDFAVVVKNSENSGEVSRVSTAKGIQRSSMVCGGIVGILKGTGSSVAECTNNGTVTSGGLNSTAFDADFDPITDYVDSKTGGSGHAMGGIVGYGLGTTESPVIISGCTNTATCYAARGYVGGIAGYVRNAAISSCHHNKKEVMGVDYDTRVGGIAGYLAASSVTSCDVIATIDGGTRAVVGGICGGMDGTACIQSSTVDGTVSYTSGTAGALVGTSVNGAKILDCTAQGSFSGQATDTFAASVNYVGDRNVTPTFSE